MFPQSGRGFIWDEPSIIDERAVTTLFVPDSKKIFNVSICTKDAKRDELHPKEWIEWEGVGERDASKPIPLIGTSLMGPTVDRPIHPEYTNQTTFRSVLLFPDRQDLVEFVGENNAWSPYVGVVKCDETDVTRGAYCVGYIERDYSKTESGFIVNKDSLKFPEGYSSERHKTIFEGLTREIELAAEEAAILASKGKTPGGDIQIIPAPKKPQYDDIGGFGLAAAQYGEGSQVVKTTDVNRPGWSKFKSRDEIEYIEKIAEFIKNRRVHDIIVYKVSDTGKGFVGFTPVVGSVPVYADSHKITGQRVEIGMNLHTRVEFNKRKKEFVVESVADIKTIPFIDFKIRAIKENKRLKRTDLLIKCPCLDLNDFQPLEGREGKGQWKGKKVGVIEHPTLAKVLVLEEQAMKEEWRGKKVRAKLLHYEGIEKDNSAKIRLVLEKIEGLFVDGSIEPLRIALENGRPDSVDSDADDDEEEEDEGCVAYSDDAREMEMKRMKEKPQTNAFAPIDNYGYGGDSGFNTQSSFDQQVNMRDERRENGGYGRNERGGGNGGRDRGGAWNNQSSSSSSSYRPPSDSRLQEGHGFEHMPMQKNPLIFDRGMLVCCSRKSSIFYTEKKRLVEYFGDARLIDGMRLGDSAEFDIESSNSLIPFRMVGVFRRINDFLPVKISVEKEEVYVQVAAYLTPRRDFFECDAVSDVSLGISQNNLKLYKGDFIEKSRIRIGHLYHIIIKFSTDDSMKWEFDSIDNLANSYVVEEMDEIDVYKRQSKKEEKIHSRRPSSRSGDDEWERVDKSDRHSKFSIPSRLPSKTPSIVSGSTQMTSTTITSEKELRDLRKENENLKRMLKNVWGYKSVQKTVKQDNYFLFETLDDWARSETEDVSEIIQ